MCYQVRGQMNFPDYAGLRCYMMPFIQGRGESLPDAYSGYSDVVDAFHLSGQAGHLGYITIDESIVDAGQSQRGYGVGRRSIHTEACLSDDRLSWGPAPTWGASSYVRLDTDLRVLIANSLHDTCMVWDTEVTATTVDGDLSFRSAEFPVEGGRSMASGEVMEIGIFTPHECIPQKVSGPWQFFRIVGTGVHGRESYFTRNEKLEDLHGWG